ncbi:MAG: hypothetical protein NC401_17280 [Ruminococcus sp.]|nr:hypothetical protein [Ruminococcus sp.]
MFSELYRTSQGDTKTVIEMFIEYSRNAMLADTQLCSYNVFAAGLNGWLTMFVPVIVSISAVGICVDERKSGMWRFALHRTGRVKYGISGGLFILLSGGLVLLCGYGLFGILAAIMFPPLSEFPAESADFFREITFWQWSAMLEIYRWGGLPLCAAARLAEAFFYGAVCSSAAMLLSAVSENKYVVICTPFFLKYGLCQLATALSYKAVEDPMNIDASLLTLANTVHPDSASRFLDSSENPLGTVALNVLFVVGSALIFCVIRVRRLKNEV